MAIQLEDTVSNLLFGRSAHGRMAKSLTKVEIQLGSSVLFEHLKILKGSDFLAGVPVQSTERSLSYVNHWRRYILHWSVSV